METDVILPKGHGCYPKDVMRISQELGAKVIIGMTKELKITVYIEGVVIVGEQRFVGGIGTTLDDACNDYMRQIRGYAIKNAINDKQGNYV